MVLLIFYNGSWTWRRTCQGFLGQTLALNKLPPLQPAQPLECNPKRRQALWPLQICSQACMQVSLSLSNLLCTVYVNTIYTHNQSEESNQEPEPPHFGMRSTKVWCDLAWTSHCRLSPFGVYWRRRSGNMLSWIWKAVLYICFTLKQHGECKRLRMIWCAIKSW